MGCNSSKDGSSPPQGDNAPKDKPEAGNEQQTTANHGEEEVTSTPPSGDPSGDPSDKSANGLNSQSQEQVQEMQTDEASPADGGDNSAPAEQAEAS